MDKNLKAQNIARETMRELHHFIEVGMSEKQILDQAVSLMTQKGSNSWWYHGLGALVLLGERSTLSISGTKYKASEENRVAENDVITIDLAPTLDGYWGDYARTIFMEDGHVAAENEPKKEQFRIGLQAELYLHQKLFENADLDMTLEALYYTLNEEIIKIGFTNLDFHGNLGHSVEIDEADRIYIERGSTATFREIGKPFTFEPHICQQNDKWGFKREDIYFFDKSGSLQRL